MTGGWSANGNTSRDWRHCPHRVGENGKCVDCRAIWRPDFIQAKQPGTGLGGIPIGSPMLIPPKLTEVTSYRSVEEHPGVFMPVKKWEEEAA